MDVVQAERWVHGAQRDVFVPRIRSTTRLTLDSLGPAPHAARRLRVTFGRAETPGAAPPGTRVSLAVGADGRPTREVVTPAEVPTFVQAWRPGQFSPSPAQWQRTTEAARVHASALVWDLLPPVPAPRAGARRVDPIARTAEGGVSARHSAARASRACSGTRSSAAGGCSLWSIRRTCGSSSAGRRASARSTPPSCSTAPRQASSSGARSTTPRSGCSGRASTRRASPGRRSSATRAARPRGRRSAGTRRRPRLPRPRATSASGRGRSATPPSRPQRTPPSARRIGGASAVGSTSAWRRATRRSATRSWTPGGARDPDARAALSALLREALGYRPGGAALRARLDTLAWADGDAGAGRRARGRGLPVRRGARPRLRRDA